MISTSRMCIKSFWKCPFLDQSQRWVQMDTNQGDASRIHFEVFLLCVMTLLFRTDLTRKMSVTGIMSNQMVSHYRVHPIFLEVRLSPLFQLQRKKKRPPRKKKKKVLEVNATEKES